MNELTVPAEYVEDFRAAIVSEIDHEAVQVESHRKKAAEYEKRGRGAAAETQREDMRNSMDLLVRDAALLALPAHNDRDHRIEVLDQGDAETVAHVLETMAQKIVGPRLAEELGYGPMDGHAAVEVREAIARLSWTVDHAAELHDLAAEQRAAGVA